MKESILKFNTKFDKRTQAGLPSCWDQQGNMLPWETYETLLEEAKSNIGTSHDKTIVLKGTTIVNYLHRYFQLLWLIRTPFTDQRTYSRISNFRMVTPGFSKVKVQI